MATSEPRNHEWLAIKDVPIRSVPTIRNLIATSSKASNLWITIERSAMICQLLSVSVMCDALIAISTEIVRSRGNVKCSNRRDM